MARTASGGFSFVSIQLHAIGVEYSRVALAALLSEILCTLLDRLTFLFAINGPYIELLTDL